MITKEDIEKDLDLLEESVDKLNGLGKTIHTHIHLLYVIKQLMKEECKNYLEIGMYTGTSISLVMQSEYNTNFYGIDDFSHKGSTDKESVEKFVSSKNKNNYEFSVIVGNSNYEEIIQYTKDTIKDGIDLFFIDGAHENDAALLDLTNYYDLVNHGGVIVFDDYETTPDIQNCLAPWLEEHKDEINNIGLVENVMEAKDARKLISKNNIMYIIQKL